MIRMKENDLLYTLALQHVPNIGDVTAKRLISHCGSAEAVLKEKKQNLASTGKMKIEAESTYRLVNRKYEEGMASQLELIDSRTNLTNAEIRNIISKYESWISFAEYERVTASYPIENL